MATKLKKVNSIVNGKKKLYSVDYENGTIDGRPWNDPYLLYNARFILGGYNFSLIKKIEQCSDTKEADELKARLEMSYSENEKLLDPKDKDRKDLMYKIFGVYGPQCRAFKKQQRIELDELIRTGKVQVYASYSGADRNRDD